MPRPKSARSKKPVKKAPKQPEIEAPTGPDYLTGMPAEMLNNILEYVVVNRDHKTGEKQAIKLKYFVILARRLLRARRTCKLFDGMIVPMFWGLNTFELKQFTESENSIGGFEREIAIPKFDMFTKGTGFEVLRYNYGPQFHNRHLRYRRAIALPPAGRRNLLKEITIVIDVDEEVYDGNGVLRTHGVEHAIAEGPPWLSIIRSLGTFGLPQLDKVTIQLKHSPENTFDASTGSQGDYEAAKKAVKQFVEASLDRMSAKQKLIKLPEDW